MPFLGKLIIKDYPYELEIGNYYIKNIETDQIILSTSESPEYEFSWNVSGVQEIPNDGKMYYIWSDDRYEWPGYWMPKRLATPEDIARVEALMQ